VTSAAVKPARPVAEVDPVARLMIDLPLPHLDRPFDYLVPAQLADAAVAGSRVRVRFAGRLVDGYLLERTGHSDHDARLALIERVVGTVPVLTAETTTLLRAVADRYGGSFVDVARLAIPARHARAEAVDPGRAEVGADRPAVPDPQGWSRYTAGASFLAAAGAGKPARASWTALPGEDWSLRIAEAMQATLAGGRGAIAVLPDARDLARLDAALASVLGPGRHVTLSADLGPSARYSRWLAVRRGQILAVAGTRAAAYAPVTDPGLFVVWDDGDDLHRDPRAPYPDTRDVLALRSSHTGAALLIGGHVRSTQAQQLIDSDWAHAIAADRATVREVAPRVLAAGDDLELARDPAARAARLPSVAWRTAGTALAAGAPVLVQVARAGYVPALACARDRSPARCAHCAGPLRMAGAAREASCAWCGRPAADWHCPSCGETGLRAVAIGARRTAEELGRAFPATLVRASGGDSVLDRVDGRPAIVVATAGAEPIADGGYGAALLLDAPVLLSRQDLRAGEEALRRWMNAASLVRAGAPVVITADAALAVVQALVRWDPAGFAARELAERVELRLPPAARMAALSGPPAAVAELVGLAPLPQPHELIGPMPTGDDQHRLLIRVPREQGGALATALHQAASARSARKSGDPVKVVLDPAELF
jgi:primosomal protein N' (replication factor Y) (superfamily II helicase)